MKGWGKVLVGILVVALLCCVAGAAMLFSGGRWEAIKGITGDTLALKKNAEGLEGLQKELPFTPPADGVVKADRLEAWLAVREALKPKADEFNVWAEAHEGKQGDFKDAREAIGLISAVMGQSVAAMRAQKLSPAEYRFLEKAMEAARQEVETKGGGGALANESLATLEALARDPALPEAKRAEIAAEAQRLRAKVDAAGQPLTANGQLYRQYGERIRATELGEFGRSMMQGGGRERHRRAEVTVE